MIRFNFDSNYCCGIFDSFDSDSFCRMADRKMESKSKRSFFSSHCTVYVPSHFRSCRNESHRYRRRICPKRSACIICRKSQQFFDILVTYSRCPNLTGYIAKDSMEKIPLLSTWMKMTPLSFF